MLSDIGRCRVAGKSVVVGDEIKAVVLGLEPQVLANCAEEIAYMKSARRLYAGKNSQINLPVQKYENRVTYASNRSIVEIM